MGKGTFPATTKMRAAKRAYDFPAIESARLRLATCRLQARWLVENLRPLAGLQSFVGLQQKFKHLAGLVVWCKPAYG